MDDIPLVDDIRGALEVGKTYRVPCLHTLTGWMPVVPLIHQDPELGNPRHHVHYDYRFFDKEDVGDIIKLEGKGNVPVINTRKVQEFTYREMVCRDAWNRTDPCGTIKEGLLFVDKIDQACQGKVFNGRVCPHKGYNLEGQEPDADGVITCPLHGARWSVKDGSYVPGLTITERMLWSYMQGRSESGRLQVRLYTNGIKPRPGIGFSDLRDPGNYDSPWMEDVAVQMDPRPRFRTERDYVTIEVKGELHVQGYYLVAEGWDRPIWMEKFFNGCNPSTFDFPKAGGTFNLKLHTAKP